MSIVTIARTRYLRCLQMWRDPSAELIINSLGDLLGVVSTGGAPQDGCPLPLPDDKNMLTNKGVCIVQSVQFSSHLYSLALAGNSCQSVLISSNILLIIAVSLKYRPSLTDHCWTPWRGPRGRCWPRPLPPPPPPGSCSDPSPHILMRTVRH